MDNASWTKIDALLDEALALPPHERTTFVERAAGGDDDLRHELTSLLAALDHVEQDGRGFLASSSDPGHPAHGAPTLTDGERVGPWTVGPLLGRGGMAEVYLAERADEAYTQTVALKLTEGRASFVRRFVAERRILASLQHPHIARLLDGGVTSDGRPYLAMEFVDGVPITEYADTRSLDVTARLRLFGQVCEAVAYAHRRLIVHRDLKPSNILVAEDDAGQPRVKLLDFGIAKLLEPSAGATVLTQANARPMTPAYAAPEQLAGEDVTTAADVYALGVVLYELLVGARPYAATGETAAALLRAMEAEEPERPSVVAERRDRPLPRRYAQDLDAVCRKALRVDPEARYPGVEALAADAERALAGLPVAARQGSTSYRVRRFVRRHRQGVVASATAATLLALVVGFYTVRLQAERDTARLETQKAERVSAFLADLFAVADPYEEVQGDTLRARDLLVRGAARVEAELTGEPEVQAAMYEAIGNVYLRLGLLDEAEPLLERALAVRREVLSPDDPDVGRSLISLGEFHLERGAFAAVDSLGEAALAFFRQPGAELDRANTLYLLGESRYHSGQYAVADSLHTLAYDLFGTHAGPDAEETVTSLIALAHVESALGHDSTAAAYTADVLTSRRRTLGDEHPLVAEALNDYGYTLRRQGRYDEAEQAYREALALKRRTLGEDHPDVATTLNNLGVLFGVTGRYEEVGPVFQKALAIRRARYGEVHPSVMQSITNLAQLAIVREDFDTASAYLQESLALARQLYDDDDPALVDAVHKQAEIRYRQGRYREAEGLYRETLAIQQRLREGDHERIAQATNNVGAMLIEQARYDAAAPLLEEALAMYRRVLGAAHVELAYPLRNLGRLATARGSYEEAEQRLTEALRLQETHLGPDHPRTGPTRAYLAALYEAWDRPEDAAAYREGS